MSKPGIDDFCEDFDGALTVLFPGTGIMGRVIEGLNSTGHHTLPMFAAEPQP